MKQIKTFDVIVIGGGLLGTFAARALVTKKLSVAVLEKAADVCTGVSKANAAIVYPGYDVMPHTLKASICVPACEDFPRLCRELGVRYKRCGSLLVCYGPEGEKSVRARYDQGRENNVQGLRLVSGAEVEAMEPHLLRGVRLGLLSEGTGTVEPWELGIAAFENARRNGAAFFFGTEVLCVEREKNLYLVRTERESFAARCIINCAGLQAAAVHDTVLPPQIGIRTSVSDLAVFGPDACDYVNHIIFVDGEDGEKGVTLIPTVDGKLMAESPLKTGTEGGLPLGTREGQEALRAMCSELVPALEKEPVLRYFAAVRPNPFDATDRRKHIGTFSVLNEDGFISLIGIKTPGMTCAEGLGRHVKDLALDYLGGAEDNDSFDPRREAPVRLSSMAEPERMELVKKDPLYGRILCRCGDVSEGEVRDAIRAGATTLDGVKRRCGTSLGLCQGDFCTTKVAKMLSEELFVPVEEVLYRHD